MNIQGEVAVQKVKTADWLMIALLVLVAVVGRVYRPEWNFTPLAAVGLFAGFFLGRGSMAALVTMFALAVSNLFEPAHTNWLVAASQYACFALPAFVGAWLPRSMRAWPLWMAGSVASSIVFFVVTNGAVWMTSSAYAPTMIGLGECYAAAVPFYRTMLAGDLFWATALFGTWALTTPVYATRSA